MAENYISEGLIELLQEAGLHPSWAAKLTKERMTFVRMIVKLRAERDELLALLERPMNDSTITMSDDPGCFFCDHEEHTEDCPAAALIAKCKEKADD